METISYHMTTLDDNDEKPPKYPASKTSTNFENQVQSALSTNQEIADFA